MLPEGDRYEVVLRAEAIFSLPSRSRGRGGFASVISWLIASYSDHSAKITMS